MDKQDFFASLLVLCSDEVVNENIEELKNLEEWEYPYILDCLNLGVKLNDSFSIVQAIYRESLERNVKFSNHFHNRILYFSNQAI